MQIKRLDLNNLSSKELEAYEKLTLAEASCYLHLQNPQQINDLHYIAIAAIENDEPVGLLLATATKTFYVAEIHSLYIDEKFRHQQIATNLMIYLEQELIKSSCIMITLLYPSDLPNTSIFKSLLKKLQWNDPIPHIDRYLFEGKIFQPSWLFKNYRYPEDITIFPWKDLNATERKELLRQETQSRFPQEVSPFLDEARIEPLNSLGMKRNGEIIGWMITHRHDPLTICYSSLYIESEYLFTSLSTRLLIEAIKIQKAAIDKGHPALLALFNLNRNQTNSSWQRFIQKRIAPYAQKTITLYQTWKNLN